jgi:hypothetical protein
VEDASRAEDQELHEHNQPKGFAKDIQVITVHEVFQTSGQVGLRGIGGVLEAAPAAEMPEAPLLEKVLLLRP